MTGSHTASYPGDRPLCSKIKARETTCRRVDAQVPLWLRVRTASYQVCLGSSYLKGDQPSSLTSQPGFVTIT